MSKKSKSKLIRNNKKNEKMRNWLTSELTIVGTPGGVGPSKN